MPPKNSKIAIVGGGHNALVSAAYLARAGLDVDLFETRSVLGGAAVTEEFAPGFRNSTASYTVSLLNPKVIKDLDLYRHGLEILERPTNNFFPYPDGSSLSMSAEVGATQASVAKLSKRDASQLKRYYDDLEIGADLLRETLLAPPPDPKGGISDLLSILRLGNRFRTLSARRQQMILDLFTKSAAAFLRDYFTDPRVIAAFAFDGIIGNYAGPEADGSAYVLLHHAFGEVNGVKGLWGHARGGMGAISDAISSAAKEAGAKLFTNSKVVALLRDGDRVTGIRLASGETVQADVVLCGINPKLISTDLLPPKNGTDSHDLARFHRRMDGWACGSGVLRMNVALDGLPNFTALPNKGADPMPHHQAGIVIAPSVDYLEQAWLDARQTGWSKAPFVEMLIPSTVDDSLAPEGKHVASLFCQYVAPKLPDGRAWADAREEVAGAMITAIDRYAPNFSSLIIDKLVLTPEDLEARFGLVGGDIFHGRLSLDQLFANRPALGMAQYRLPLAGLYLCGSGAHPGGGVTGVPGHNAARQVLKDMGMAKRFPK